MSAKGRMRYPAIEHIIAGKSPGNNRKALPLKDFTESAMDYMSRTNLNVKVLDFVQLGGRKCIEGGTIFEMWLGILRAHRGP